MFPQDAMAWNDRTEFQSCAGMRGLERLAMQEVPWPSLAIELIGTVLGDVSRSRVSVSNCIMSLRVKLLVGA